MFDTTCINIFKDLQTILISKKHQAIFIHHTSTMITPLTEPTNRQHLRRAL